MATRMQQRRGTAAQWISTNAGNGPILNAGEIGYETDTNKFKIGDGVNHWIDLTYFTDAASVIAEVTGLIDGAPDLLNTLNEIANSLGDDPDFVGTMTNSLNDKQDKVTGVSDTEIGYLDGVTSSIQGQLDSKSSSEALSDHTSATTNVHGIADTSLLATQEYVDTAVGNSTVDQSTLAGVGIDWNLVTEQFDVDSTIATTDYVDTAIGNIDALPSQATNDGRFLQTDGTTASWQIVDLSTKQDKVTNVSDTEIGYLDGVTSAIQTQLNAKVNSSDVEEISRDTLGAALFSGNGIIVTPDDPTDMITVAVDDSVVQLRVSGISDTEIGYLNGVTSAIQTQIDTKAPSASPTFTGTVTLPANTISQIHLNDDSVGTNEIGGLAVTEGKIADGAVTSAKIANGTIVDADINASAAIAQSKISGLTADLAAKAPLASPTFTGTVNAAALTLSGDLIVNGTTTTVNTSSISVSDSLIYIADGNNANTVDLGFIGSYNDGTYAHQGFVKDASDGKWKLFKGVTDEPTTTVNFAQGSLDALAVGAFEATSAIIGNVSNTELQYLDGVTSAIQTQIDSKQATLPSQSGNSGKYLTNNGSGTLSWATVSGYLAPTLGSTSIASGATVTTLAGLTLTAPTLTGTTTAADITVSGKITQKDGFDIEEAIFFYSMIN